MLRVPIIAFLSCITCAEEISNISDSARVPSKYLAFGVMTYQKREHSPELTIHAFLLLMSKLYDPSHLYVLHVDVKSDNDVHKNISEYCFSKPNCVMISPRNVAWAGLTTGEMMFALMQKALETSINWSSFVFVGHESMLLTSVSYIEDYMASFSNQTNFINCWEV